MRLWQGMQPHTDLPACPGPAIIHLTVPKAAQALQDLSSEVHRQQDSPGPCIKQPWLPLSLGTVEAACTTPAQIQMEKRRAGSFTILHAQQSQLSMGGPNCCR